jgi:mycoredoxin
MFARPAENLDYGNDMDLLVYSAPWCPDCRAAKRFLERHGIPFQEINIEATPGAVDEVVRRTGKRAIPQFVIDGEWVQPYRPGEGFLYEEMSELLGVVDEG